MSVMVPLEELRSELERRSNAAYLLTVGDGGRPHCVAVGLEWEGDELVMRAGATSARNADSRRQVTLLSPPPGPALVRGGLGDPGDSSTLRGFSLIVDGEVTATSRPDSSGSVVRVRPTHAVLHRPAVAPGGGPVHDCVAVYDEVGSPAT